MIQNIVDRAKKMAIKDFLEQGSKGLRLQHLVTACLDEFRENEDLPNTTNPDDWARISGKKGERIVYIRTLVTGKGAESGSGDRHDLQHRPVPVARPEAPPRARLGASARYGVDHGRRVVRGERGGAPARADGVGAGSGVAAARMAVAGRGRRRRRARAGRAPCSTLRAGRGGAAAGRVGCPA